MSTIVIKTENIESEDVKPEIKEGGGVSSCGSVVVGGGAGGGGGGVTIVGPKTIVEKTQAALKVASEAKQLNLRLKGQHLQQHSTSTNKNNKRASKATAEGPKADNVKSKLPHKAGSKRCRLQTSISYGNKSNIKTPPPLAASPTLLTPSKCGEIFVTNNARKWTFVCTYCQKTTRDIGEFVCHIKFKHMDNQYNEEDDCKNEDDNAAINNHDNQPNLLDDKSQEEDSYVTQDQDYFDCANYLDVNVHTESDELPTNGVKNQTNKKTVQKTQAKETNNRQMTKSKYVVDLLDDEDEIDTNKRPAKDTRSNMEIFDYDLDDEDGVEIVEDDNDEMDGGEDDQLAFLRSHSMDDTQGESGGGGGGSGGGSKPGSRKYRSHVRGKAYCNLCDKTFQYYSLYRNHMIKHSNITPYKCQYCSKAFKSKQAIRYHMNTHTKEVQYTCPLCPTTYGTENQFITHVLNHESDTCFPCMVCAKILKSDRERDIHLEIHTEERPFGCEFCNKRFRQKHHLSNHLKLHCQYRCDFCKEEFSSTQTQRRPYACPTCEEYPGIRIQVEKQRSKSLNNPDVNPLELTFENIKSEANTECVDLAEISDEESETSTSILGGPNDHKRVTCQYCTRSYKHNSALNYHMRQKHPHIWNEMK